MPISVIMPQLGESVLEGTITKWLKAVGDPIEEYEPLIEINTDKVDTEIPSPATGILLEILAPEGATVQAGETLAYLSETLEDTPQMPSQPEKISAVETTQALLPGTPVPPSPERTTSQAVENKRDLGFISPVVGRIASEEGIDLYQVQGTGQGGRITKRDVLNYLDARKAAPQPTEPIPSATFLSSPTPAVSPTIQPQAGELLPLNTIRKSIAEHMVMSKRTSPHVSTIMEADLSRVVAHREANKAVFARDGVNLTFTAYFVAATVVALKAYPLVNSSWSEQGIILHPTVNIGMATSLGEEGLIVPVIKNADRLSLLGLAKTVNDLANRARARKLLPDEVKGGTFTITNHGITGSLFATPIINQPQCGILGVGAIQKRVVVLSDKTAGDTIAIRPMVYLSLTFDHRILDGATADWCLAKVVESLQNWN